MQEAVEVGDHQAGIRAFVRAEVVVEAIEIGHLGRAIWSALWA